MRKQKDIAKSLGVSTTHISYWLNGRVGISRELAIKLAQTYGRDPGFFMFGDIEEIKAVLFFTCPLNAGSEEVGCEIDNQRACR